jgi:hypothetical protein
MVGVANDTTIYYTKAMKSWTMKIAINMNGRHKYFFVANPKFLQWKYGPSIPNHIWLKWLVGINNCDLHVLHVLLS